MGKIVIKSKFKAADTWLIDYVEEMDCGCGFHPRRTLKLKQKKEGDADNKYRKLYSMLHGGSFFSIECKENYELIRELTSYGANLVVLSPQSVIDDIQQRIAKMQEIYNSTNIANKEFV